ncbi:hypothetical protein [Streptomyces chrestomyceticus]|uniref:hypothetical protein n=1 Tax=Streptomyces chrestomyceticus TaxID=68185 RepID=UPI0037AC0287
MELPFIVVDQLTPQQEHDWHTFFGTRGADRPRDIEEGIWRRPQEQATAAQSGWQPGDARRRMVHYRYRYGLATTTGAPALAQVVGDDGSGQVSGVVQVLERDQGGGGPGLEAGPVHFHALLGLLLRRGEELGQQRVIPGGAGRSRGPRGRRPPGW